MLDRRETLKSAITKLRDALALFVEAQMPGAQVPSREVILRAAQLTAEAHLELEAIAQPRNPYADDELRPGLNFHLRDEPELPLNGDNHA